jgi:predicted transglutaminase-like cysteine proteinase
MKLTGLAMAIGLALIVHVSSALAASNLIFTKTDYPDFILRRAQPLRQSEILTAELLTRSDIPQVKAYRDFLDRKARGLSRTAQLAAVNAYVNDHVKQMNDFDLYLRDDIWATPVNTLTIGGDCEDIALVKRWGLNRLGVPDAELYLIIGVTLTTTPPSGHAVLGVKAGEGDVWILDSLRNKVTRPAESTLEPAYGLNAFGFWRVDTPGHVGDDYNQRALERALARQRR